MDSDKIMGLESDGPVSAERQAILSRLEHGDINVAEALRQLDQPAEERVDDSAGVRGRAGVWRLWWAIFLGSGIGLAVMAAGLATLGGWWWLAAAPAGLVAVALLAMAVLSLESPFLLISIETGSASWPQSIRFGVPLPLKLIAGLLRAWPGRDVRLRGTAVDELILSLDAGLQADHPLVIDVHEGRGGERVRVYIG
jgi:hypothetical protein